MNEDVERIPGSDGKWHRSTIFEAIKVNIDEDKQEGTVAIKDVISNWYWDKELDIWIKENN